MLTKSMIHQKAKEGNAHFGTKLLKDILGWNVTCTHIQLCKDGDILMGWMTPAGEEYMSSFHTNEFCDR